MTPPFGGQPGHGRTAFLRRQLARVAEGRLVGSYTDVFELICPSCGDYPHLDYSQVSPRLQWLRGPRPLESAVAVYHKHLGLPRWLPRTEPERSVLATRRSTEPGLMLDQ
jgi:hypothetical protein